MVAEIEDLRSVEVDMPNVLAIRLMDVESATGVPFNTLVLNAVREFLGEEPPTGSPLKRLPEPRDYDCLRSVKAAVKRGFQDSDAKSLAGLSIAEVRERNLSARLFTACDGARDHTDASHRK